MSPKDQQPAEAPEVECQACGILIGPDHVEMVTHEVGRYRICSWCLNSLTEYGQLLVMPYSANLWLTPSGEVFPKKTHD